MSKKAKLIITGMVWSLYFIVCKLFKPIIINKIAITQFDDSIQSYTNTYIYNLLNEYTIIVLIIITLMIFAKEIKSFVKDAMNIE